MITITEKGEWSYLAAYCEQRNVDSILLITGRSSYVASGAEAKLSAILENKRVCHIDDFETNPKVEDVTRLLDGIRKNGGFDIILAVGGGSVIDVAKLLKAFWNSQKPVIAHLEQSEPLQPADTPLIAIPTTAGSGSEATHFAVVYQNKTKYSIAHDALLPDVAIIDSSLLSGLPQPVAAASGMDALCQGIESYWSIHSTDESRTLAREAVTLAWKSLRPAVAGKDPKALEDLARASHLAGQAINITKTTAPHAVSYALTSCFGVPHGHAVGLLTPYFFKYNAEVSETDCLDPRGPDWAKQSVVDIVELLGYQTVEQAVVGLGSLILDLGLEADFGKLGIKSKSDIELVLEHGFNPQRINNNPRRVTRESLHDILTRSN